ncbi:acetyltransferase [Sphaerisporangium melleum]|uniref:Acetyltransferase n=1 Tax=Sphaerisporangium melleum TaxID=321316 RepID=A0A917RS97_9ACTN|nr:GNAT family N-acetyltransferase [Sphaerisporangium melleum]GGL20153.1 acetyltransferase [Sphaerisporangium melleum]GII71305.1 acetyltransferase [Sphaerisporangium melleum]
MSGESVDLEALVHQAWPAPHQEMIGGWIARYAEGVTNRANSVLPWGEPEDLDTAVDAAERFYAERGRPCVFSIGPRAPEALDGHLDRRGYRLVDEVRYMAAPIDGAVPRAAHPVTIAEEPGPGWLGTWWEVDGRFDRGLAAAERIVRGVPAAYAAVEEGGRPVAVGRSVLQGEMLGIYCMATLPHARRRGLGRSVLRALLARGRAQGATRAYLVVLERNARAIAMYHAEGFTLAGRYHYRVR